MHKALSHNHKGIMMQSVRHPYLWSRELIYLFAATFIAYSSISLFFFFYEHLKALPIDPALFGLIISVFSGVSLAARPIVSPFFHKENAYRYLAIGTLMLAVALAAYSLAGGFWSMLAVRAFHGLSFVVLGAALMTITVEYVPEGRSAQFFGLISIIVLIPNSLIPPMLPFLRDLLGDFTRVLALFGALTLLVIPLLKAARSSDTGRQQGLTGQRPSWAEILADIRDPAVLLILFAMLLLYSSYALVFFFLDGFGRLLGIEKTGLFLTLATAGEIAVRVLGGGLFDKTDKIRLALFTMLVLCASYALLGRVKDINLFYTLGLILGLGWGIAMPVFNGLMYDISRPTLRAFNTNLGFQMFQGGFFLGPFAGGPIVAKWSYGPLFDICALSSLLAGCLLFVFSGRIREDILSNSA
jgi:predicted MFS family arabinose efflux permease